MAFSPPVLGCLVKKGLQKGGSRPPQDPPWLRPCVNPKKCFRGSEFTPALLFCLDHALLTRQGVNKNLLLTEREGEYWLEVVTVRTSLRSVRTKTTEDQYSAVRPERARLVSSLLYGTLWCLFQFLNQKFPDL